MVLPPLTPAVGLRRALYAALWLMVGVLPSEAQQSATETVRVTATGRVTGKVFSSQNGEPVASAQVFLDGAGAGALTDLNGRYVLDQVPAGTHAVTVQSLGYAQKTVSDVEVVSGETAVLDITVAPQAIELESITVEASVERGTTTALLTDRKLAANVTDAIGAVQIARSPDGTAAAALKRVPGVSVVDGKYVYVRGLGERYASTTLNGAPLPSPEPDKKVIPLDLFPSGLLESVVTAKTYTPDQPGDYAGGLVQIRTRAFPAFRTLKISSGLGYNTESSFGEGLGHIGELGFLGLNRIHRDLPSLVPRNQRLTTGTMSAEQLEQIGDAFALSAWGPTAAELPANYSTDISLGGEWSLAGRPLGLLLSVSHGTDVSHQGDAIERVFGSALLEEPEVDYRGETSARTASTGALANVSTQLSPTDNLKLETVYTRTAEDESRVLEGFFFDSNTNVRNTRLRYIEQTLLNTQLSGDHLLGFLNDSRLKWRGAYSRATRFEPDTRQVLYRETSAGFRFEDFVESGSIFHQDLGEDGYSGGIDLKIPFQFRSLASSLSLGGSFDMRERDVYTRRLRFANSRQLSEETRRLPPNELFTAENIGAGAMRVQEATFPEDNYEATQDIYAGYLMVDLELLPRLRLSTGARVEQTTMDVHTVNIFDSPLTQPEPARLEETDVLPATNLTYALSDQMNLRLGASRTLARPQFRELAPFPFANYFGGFLVIGNPTLNRSRIQNFDARWEIFTGQDGVIGVSGFYKTFDEPIEVVVVPSSEFIQTWVNAEDAEVYGLELEVRSGLGILGSAFQNLSVNGNLTLAESTVETGDSAQIYLQNSGPTFIAVSRPERSLQGQSPYVINLGVTYASPGTGTRATVLYNRFGRRIDAVGARQLPDIYEEARDQLDLTIEQPLPWNLELKASASRLLGSVVEFTQGGDLLRRYDTGRSISLSIGWELGGR